MTILANTAHTQPIDEEVMMLLNNYALATELNDEVLLDSAFHKNFRVVAMTAEGLRVIEKASYLSLIKDKKIGGHKRELKIGAVIEGDNIMQVSLTLSGKEAVFYDHLAIIKEDGGWQILHNSTHVKSRK